MIAIEIVALLIIGMFVMPYLCGILRAGWRDRWCISDIIQAKLYQWLISEPSSVSAAPQVDDIVDNRLLSEEILTHAMREAEDKSQQLSPAESRRFERQAWEIFRDSLSGPLRLVDNVGSVLARNIVEDDIARSPVLEETNTVAPHDAQDGIPDDTSLPMPLFNEAIDRLLEEHGLEG